jgi:hypothetical protein
MVLNGSFCALFPGIFQPEKARTASKKAAARYLLQRVPVLEIAMKKIAIVAIGLSALAISACAPRYYDRYDRYDRYGYYGPRDHVEYADRDRDGVPNRYDRDRDNDGVPNYADRHPYNPDRN